MKFVDMNETVFDGRSINQMYIAWNIFSEQLIVFVTSDVRLKGKHTSCPL